MSLVEEDDCKPWTDDDLKEAIRRINSGEMTFQDAHNEYGISARTLHRQRAIENMRAQLNPEKGRKKTASSSNPRKDVTDLRKAVEISCSSIGDVLSLLEKATEEVKQLINYECDLIYECKVCKSLFRSLVNFISHKRIYCCDLYSVLHTQNDENDDGCVEFEDKIKAKENFKEFISRPFRVTCRKDLTTILKRITSISEFLPNETILNLESLENSSNAYRQNLISRHTLTDTPESNHPVVFKDGGPSCYSTKVSTPFVGKSVNETNNSSTNIEKKFNCPICPVYCATKRSICRHLKNVHHKSDEQIEKLKTRIQNLVVKKKNSNKNIQSASSTSVLGSLTTIPSKTIPASSSSKVMEKGDWEKDCQLCNLHFINRNTYASHVRVCRRNFSKNDRKTAQVTLSSAFLPFVSLTPIDTASLSSVFCDAKMSEKNKLVKNVTSPTRTVPPANSSTSTTKKIGIQVRMNYGKDQVAVCNSSPNSCLSPTATSSVSSAPTSRRNSWSYSRETKSNSLISDVMNSCNTKDNNRLFDKLLQKRLVDGENQDLLGGKQDNLIEDTKKQELGFSIYCEDCKKTFALKEYKENFGDSINRNFRCIINDCDFRTSCTNDLLPHLSEKHSVLTGSISSEINTVFSIESQGSCLSLEKNCSSHFTNSNIENPKEINLNLKQQASSGKRQIASLLIEDGHSKRKKNGNTIEIESRDENEKTGLSSCEIENEAAKFLNKKLNIQPIKKVKNVTAAKRPQKIVVKEEEKIAVKEVRKLSDRTFNLHNGIEHFTTYENKIRTVELDQKSDNILNTKNIESTFNGPPETSKKVNHVHSNYTPPLSQEVDLDPSKMSEENYRKSIMNILFGKQILEGNAEIIVRTDRDKSPSSSTSSCSSNYDNNQVHSFRTSKQLTKSSKISLMTAVDCEEKYKNISLLNNAKTKNSR